jgi:hypothetical protein
MDPCLYVGWLLTDTEMDRSMEQPIDSLRFMDLATDVWECGECGRLAVNWPNIGDGTVKWYRPEDGEPGHLMKRRPNDTAESDGS